MVNRIKLTRFRIQNYQCIDDSDWIDIEDVTALVGKNESGKTALLTALYKLNPATEAEYDGLYDFPRSRFTDEFTNDDWIVSTGEFTIPPSLLEGWKPPKDYAIPDEGITLTLTRHYSGEKYWDFDPDPKDEDYLDLCVTNTANFRKMLSRKQPQTLDPSTEEETSSQKLFTAEIKTNILKLMDSFLEKPELNAMRKLCDDLGSYTEIIPELPGELDKLEDLIKLSKQTPSSELLWEKIKKEVPVFIYFENYGILKGRIHIPTFVGELDLHHKDSSIRTQETLFKHVKLDPKELYEKGDLGVDYNALRNADPTEAKKILEKYSPEVQRAIEHRQILVSSASAAMSKKFSGWWEQKTHNFVYKVDQNYFEVLVSDDTKPDQIPFDSRSKGLKWFFSFYLVFLVESDEMHKNAILLLDEPGLSLHPTGQLNLINFLNNLKETNQVIYSTHSPFLIDGDHLERVRGVIENKKTGNTEVVTHLGIIDKHTAFPLQILLGYSIMQTIFLGKKHLILEGFSDYNYIKGMSLVLDRFASISLDNDIVLVPSGGASKISFLASLFIAQGSKPVVLLDADKVGIGKKQSLQMNLFATQQENLLLVNEFVDGIDNPETEDIIGAELLLESLKKVFEKAPTTEEFSDEPFVVEVKKWYKKKKFELPKEWKVLLAVQFNNDMAVIDKDSISNEVLTRFKKLISKINDLSTRQVSK